MALCFLTSRAQTSGSCCICLEQSAWDSTIIAIIASFPQWTEDWTFCPVLQLLWLINVSLHWLLRGPTITVTCPCSPRTYATVNYIRSSSSSSSNVWEGPCDQTGKSLNKGDGWNSWNRWHRNHKQGNTHQLYRLATKRIATDEVRNATNV